MLYRQYRKVGEEAARGEGDAPPIKKIPSHLLFLLEFVNKYKQVDIKLARLEQRDCLFDPGRIFHGHHLIKKQKQKEKL